MKFIKRCPYPLIGALLLSLPAIAPPVSAAPAESASTAAAPTRTVAGRWKTSLLVSPNGKPYPVDPEARHIVPPAQELILEQNGEMVTGVLKPAAPNRKGLEAWDIEIKDGSFRNGELRFTLKSDGPTGPIMGGGGILGNTLRGGVGTGRNAENTTYIWSAERIPDRTNSDPDGTVSGRWSLAEPGSPDRQLVLAQDGENVTGMMKTPYIDGHGQIWMDVPVKGTFHKGRLALAMRYNPYGDEQTIKRFEAFLKGDALTGSMEESRGDMGSLSEWSAHRLSPSAPELDTSATGVWDVTLPDRTGHPLRRKMLLTQTSPTITGLLSSFDNENAPRQNFYGRLENGVLTFETASTFDPQGLRPLRHRVNVGSNTMKGSTTLPAEDGDTFRVVTWEGKRIAYWSDSPDGTWALSFSQDGKTKASLTLSNDGPLGWTGLMVLDGDGAKIPLRNLSAEGEKVRFWIPDPSHEAKRMEFTIRISGNLMTGSAETPDSTKLFSGSRRGAR